MTNALDGGRHACPAPFTPAVGWAMVILHPGQNGSSVAATHGDKERYPLMATQVNVGLFVRLEALPGKEDDVAAFLDQGLALDVLAEKPPQ